METQIVPCRAEISDRFPVASFAVNVPPARCFEVACATDPRLFHTDWQRYRSPRNFYSSRSEGLMRAPDGHTAWFIPPEQLRRFAGSQRIYYALATYDTAYGGSPQFSIAPDALDSVPFVALAPDFTGRGLDRSRLGIIPPPPDAYGAVDSANLSWGGDEALAAYRAAESAFGGYDDGYPTELWNQPAGEPVAEQAGMGDGYAHELGDSCGDAYDEEVSVAAALAADAGPADSGTFVPDEEEGAYSSAHAAEGPADSGTFEPDEATYSVGHAAAEGPADSGTFDPDAAELAHAAGDTEYGEYGEEEHLDGYGAADGYLDTDDGEPYGSAYPNPSAFYSGAEDSDDDHEDHYDELAAGAGYDATALDDGDDEPHYEDDGYGSAYAPAGPDATAYGDGSADGYGSGGGYGSGEGYGSVQGYNGNGSAPSTDYGTAYGLAYPTYGGGYDPTAESDGGVAVADPEIETAEAQAAAPAPLAGRDPGYSEEVPEEEPLPVGHAVQALAVVPLDVAEKVRILRVVAKAESGADGYTAINPDNEYNDPGHPAYHRYHIGLSWGFIQFTQRGGALGRVLAAIRRREDTLGAALPAEHRMAALFGPHWNDLLRVTCAGDEEARVAPVGGKVLWEREWTDRFRAAGRVPHVTWAQNEIAVTDFVDLNLRFAHWLGFDNARALAMLFDRCIHMGNGGGTSWIMRSCGPVRTDEERRAALAALGHADLRAFQQSQAPHLTVDGKWGPKTHAALVAALRALGSRSPVAIPSRDAMLQRLADASAGTRFQRRLTALHTNRADFDDATTYTLV
ncbi:MAG TPA: hypothetical protein VFS20_26845 [Longimicrobium sp.]|nr:hypothetical protein [Longimicrobium sp.]